MVRIISDTSTLYSSTQAQEAGFFVAPLSVTIAGKSYREFDEISSDAFVDIIRQGHLPTSSQPAIGEVAALFEHYSDEEIVCVSMAAGLSGTFDSAVTAASLCNHRDKISVVNTRTLCGPHRYLVEKAVQWAQEGETREAIVEKLTALMDTAKSYLLPADFDYLRRGGRLSPLVAYVGKTANLTPVMTQTDNGERLTVACVRRGFTHALKYIVGALEKAGVGHGWQVHISHASAPDKAQQALEILQTALPGAEFRIYPLSPAFITQGGPGCVAVQYIKM